DEAHRPEGHGRRQPIADREIAFSEERERNEGLLLDPIPEHEQHEEDSAGNKQTRDTEQAPVAAARVEGRDIGEGPPVIALALNQPDDEGKQGATGAADHDSVDIPITAEAT